MELTSEAFQHNGFIPSKYTCQGEDVSPQLTITNVPSNAKSLVLIVDDPDAPSKTWVHWVVYNIDPSVSDIPEGTVPQGGIEGMTDFGNTEYGGPCPPSGTHRYRFKLYALDSMLEISDGETLDVVEEAMHRHITDETELVGLYKKS
jgi:Raf kinase inhibitor-like YbhB/YbcL family protein